jgi:hypothetical protein
LAKLAVKVIDNDGLENIVVLKLTVNENKKIGNYLPPTPKTMLT